MKIIYIAGPFRGDGTKESKCSNIEVAREFVHKFIRNQIFFYSPHLNIDQEMVNLPGGEGTFSWNMNFEFLKKCDALAVLPGWKNSKGTKEEIKNAERCNLPVFYLEKENSIKEILFWLEKSN